MQCTISCLHATYILGEEPNKSQQRTEFLKVVMIFSSKKYFWNSTYLPLLVSATVSMKLFLLLTVNTLLVCLLSLLSLSA